MPAGGAHAEDGASLRDGISRALRRPWKMGEASRLSLDAFAERYASSRGLGYDAEGATPTNTWLLSSLRASKSHSLMRGALAGGASGLLFYGEHAAHTSRGYLMEGRTVAVYELTNAGDLGGGLACVPRYGPLLGGHVKRVSAVPDGLAPVMVGDASFQERYEVGAAGTLDPESARLLFTPDFVEWMNSLAVDGSADEYTRFEILGGALCVYAMASLKTSQLLDAFCANAARIASQVERTLSVESD